VNLTYSKEISKRKQMVVRFMMGTSVRYPIRMNKKCAQSRVEKMETLQWVANYRDVLTKEQLTVCKHSSGNCSKSMETMIGQTYIYIYIYMLSLFLSLNFQTQLSVKEPCDICQYVMKQVSSHRVATIYLS
jgi:hypothetical protein